MLDAASTVDASVDLSSSGARAWTAPALLAPGSFPDVGLDAAGNAVLVWHSTNDAIHTQVYGATAPAGGTFGTPELLGTSDEQRSYSSIPFVAVNAAGVAAAGWQLIVGSTMTLALRRYQPATGWGAAVDAQTGLITPGPISKGPGIALADTGEAIALWTQVDSGAHYNQWATISDSDGTFATATPIRQANLPASGNLRAAITRDGRMAIVVWNGSSTEYAAVWSKASGWTAALALDDAANQGNGLVSPVVAISDAGEGIVAWQSVDPLKKHTVRLRTLDAGVWSAVVAVVDPSGKQTGAPSVFVDSTGTQLTWSNVSANRTDGGSRGVWTQRRPHGSSWQAPARLDDPASAGVYSIDARLVGDGAGGLLAMWNQDYNLWYSRYDAVAGWSTAALLPGSAAVPDDASANTWPYALAMDPLGRAVAVWSSPTASVRNVTYSFFR